MSKRPRRSRRKSALPKGAYRLPQGGHVTESVHVAKGRRIRIRAVHRAEPDYKKLALALLELAKQQRNCD